MDPDLECQQMSVPNLAVWEDLVVQVAQMVVSPLVDALTVVLEQAVQGIGALAAAAYWGEGHLEAEDLACLKYESDLSLLDVNHYLNGLA